MAWLNNARVISVFAVILLHISSWFVSSAPFDSLDWWVGNLLDSLVRWCVPVFVMISGALLLDAGKRVSLKEFYCKRMSKILIPMVFWSVFYLMFISFKKIIFEGGVNYAELFSLLMQGKPYYHLWYLYMISLIYLFSPFFKKITDNSSDAELIFLVCAMFLISMINTIADSVRQYYHARLFVALFLDYIPYFFLGHLINKFQLRFRHSSLWFSFFVLVIITALGAYSVDAMYMQHIESYFYNNKSINVILMSMVAFLIFKLTAFDSMYTKLIEKIAPIVFGVYLLHPLYLDVSLFLIKKYEAPNAIIAIPLLFLITSFLSMVTSLVMTKAPYLNRLI